MTVLSLYLSTHSPSTQDRHDCACTLYLSTHSPSTQESHDTACTVPVHPLTQYSGETWLYLRCTYPPTHPVSSRDLTLCLHCTRPHTHTPGIQTLMLALYLSTYPHTRDSDAHACSVPIHPPLREEQTGLASRLLDPSPCVVGYSDGNDDVCTSTTLLPSGRDLYCHIRPGIR